MVGSLLRTEPLKEARAKLARGRDRRRSASRGRGPRDREDHRPAGRDRPAVGDRRRVPPVMVAFRFSRRSSMAASCRSSITASSSTACRPRRRASRSSARSAGRTNHPMLEHFRFLKAHTRLVPKMTIPSPSVLHFRLGLQRHQAGLSGHRRVLRRSRPPPTARRSAPSTTPAAAICSSTTRSGPISASTSQREAGERARRRRRPAAGASTPAPSTRRSKAGRPT